MNNLRLNRGTLLAIGLCGGFLLLTGCGTSKQTTPSHRVSYAARRFRLTGSIVFRRFFDESHHSGALFIIGADGGRERQLSHPGPGAVDSLNGPPSYAAHQSTFVFDRTDANGKGSLWSIHLDGTDEHRLRSLGGLPGDGWPTFSPDGRLIAVARAWGRPDRYRAFAATARGRLRRDWMCPAAAGVIRHATLMPVGLAHEKPSRRVEPAAAWAGRPER